MMIYVTNREFLFSKLEKFYESRYEKLKKEKKGLRKDEIIKHLREMGKFISKVAVNEQLD